MQTQMHRVSYGIALILLATGLGSCQLLGSNEKASDATASLPTEVPATPIKEEAAIKATDVKVKKTSPKQVIAASPLTRPTDPDARVKVIKKGRTDPFALLIPTNIPKSTAQPALKTTKSTRTVTPRKSSTKPALKSRPAPKTAALPRLTAPSDSSKGFVLPPLPEPTLSKQVKVLGVMVIGGQPKAILSAPDEGVSRTVGVGDYLANGQILISSIDVSNQQEPVVVLKESGRTVSVGVGKEPIVAGASLNSDTSTKS